MSADTSIEFDSCVECGEPFETEPAGSTYHVTADGDRDYDRDADHVAIPDDGYGEIVASGGSGRHFVVLTARFEMDQMDGTAEQSAEIALGLTLDALSAHWTAPHSIEITDFGDLA